MDFMGYHATSESNALDIEKFGFIDSNENNWLGRGVYFWGDVADIVSGLETARWWIKIKKLYPPVIFSAKISSDKFFDVVGNSKHKKYYNKIKSRLVEKDKGKIISDDEYIAGVFVLLAEHYNGFRFLTKGDKYTGVEAADRLITDLQVQLCVLNHKCIQNLGRI